MNIAIIDADLIGKKKHRFPNLASMKISGYHKELGDFVTLKTDDDDLKDFDKVYISKVFTDTPVDENVLNLPYVQYGGTGFMRFNRYVESPYAGVYKTVAAWCNQPSFFKKKSLREFGIESLKMQKARNKYIVDFEQTFPEFREYMDMKWK